MKWFLILLVLCGCYYDDDLCPRDTQLKALNIQIRNEQILIKSLSANPLPYSEDVLAQLAEEEDNLNLLLIDKAILESSPCK